MAGRSCLLRADLRIDDLDLRLGAVGEHHAALEPARQRHDQAVGARPVRRPRVVGHLELALHGEELLVDHGLVRRQQLRERDLALAAKVAAIQIGEVKK